MGLVQGALAHDLDPWEAAQWWQAGLSPQVADQLQRCGIDLVEARQLKAELGRSDAVLEHALAAAS